MALKSRTLALVLGVVLGATWGVTAHAEDAVGSASTPGGAGDAGAAAKKPAAKTGGGAKTGGAAKTGGGVAKTGTTSAKKAKAGTSKDVGAAVRKLSGAPEGVSGPEVRNFQAFCDEWMQKLRDRETYNTSHITWDTHDGRVSGDYVGYDTKCTCIAREEPGKDPIGKITYRETRYRREGASESAALAAPATAVEQSDVTEIFRFGKGRWQY